MALPSLEESMRENYKIYQGVCCIVCPNYVDEKNNPFCLCVPFPWIQHRSMCARQSTSRVLLHEHQIFPCAVYLKQKFWQLTTHNFSFDFLSLLFGTIALIFGGIFSVEALVMG